MLSIGLRELNGSGHGGTVWLGDDGYQTIIEIKPIEPVDFDQHHPHHFTHNGPASRRAVVFQQPPCARYATGVAASGLASGSMTCGS